MTTTTPSQSLGAEDPASSSGPLSPEHLQAIDEAGRRAKKILRVASLAMFNACTFGFFASCGLLVVMISAALGEVDLIGLLVSVALGVVTWNELRGRAMVRRFELHGPTVLGWNQIALMGVIFAYCIWMIVAALIGPSELEEEIAKHPELEGYFGDLGQLQRTLTIVVYGAVILGSAIFQGLNSAYYFRSVKTMREYVVQTPQWVIELQRSGRIS